MARQRDAWQTAVAHAVRRRRRPGHLRGPGCARQPNPRRQGDHRWRHRRPDRTAPLPVLRSRPRPARTLLRQRRARSDVLLPQVQQMCKKGRDANAQEDCDTVAVANSVQAFWTQEFTRRGGTYTPSPTVFFSNQAGTACGSATSAVGPFYCPADRKGCLDLGCFDELRTSSAPAGGRSRRRTYQPHGRRHPRRSGRGDGRRRRPGPGEVPGPGDPGDLDARLGRAASAVVLRGLQHR